MKRVAIVSFDHLHSLGYLDVLRSHTGVELVGICDDGPNREVAARKAETAGIPFSGEISGYLTWGVDGIYIGTTPHRHREVVAVAAANGVHVMCDKPIATTLEDADAILEATRRGRIGLSVPFRPVFQDPVRLAMERIRAGTAGEVQAIYAVKYGRPPSTANDEMNTDWFYDRQLAGVGGFGDIGSHALDAMCRLAGSAPVRVFGRLAADGPIDDLGTAHLEFANNVHGVLSAGWANPVASARWLEVRFEVLTTTHAFVVSAPYREIEVITATGRRLIPWEKVDLNRHVDDFVRAMSGQAPEVNGDDARSNLALLLAVHESAASGHPVPVPA